MLVKGTNTIVLIFLISCVVVNEVTGEIGKQCYVGKLFTCTNSEICVQKAAKNDVGVCKCRTHYMLDTENECVPIPTIPTIKPSPNFAPTAEPHTHQASGGNIAAGVIIPLMLITGLIGASIYFGRKYNWLRKIRQFRPVTIRRSNDVSIGNPDDDVEPIA